MNKSPIHLFALTGGDNAKLAILDPAVLVAHDAFEAGDTERAMGLLVGLPCTVGIGSDRYGGKVVKTTRCTITVEAGPCSNTFRFTKQGWRSGGSYRLSVGEADDYRDPSF